MKNPRLIKIINEEIALIEDYPKTWDIDHFKTLSSYNKRIEYCNQQLTKIGAGTSRIVYKIDDEKVLKLAKNQKGIAQNEVEIEYSQYNDINHMFAKTFNFHDDSLWVEMEYCKKLTKPLFKSIIGYDFDLFAEALKYEYYKIKPIKGVKIKKPESDIEFWEDEFFYDIISFTGNYDIPVGDLTRLSTYGVSSKKEIVMVDYGLNSNVMASYYTL